MNISSPLPNNDDDFFNYCLGFLVGTQDQQPSKQEEQIMGGAKKRKRRAGRAEKNDVKIAQLVSALQMLEEQGKEEEQEWEKTTREEKQLLESNHKRKVVAMLEYYNHLQAYYSQLEEADVCRAKRARLGTAAVAAAVSKHHQQQQQQGGAGGGGAVHRRLWVKDRSQEWWEFYNQPDFPEAEFRRAFRMSRPTFDLICDELSSAVAKEDTMLRAAIPVRQRVAVCIWRLATGEPLRLVSKRFGLGISTCHKLVLEVCSAIKTLLMPKFLHWPDQSRIEKIKEEFEQNSGIPNVVGSMYTTHIPIIAPKISVAAYFNKRHTERNQKTSYSITVQGVVDPSGVFTDVCIGWPGSMPDDQVLEKSALYQRASGGLLKGVWIVGSSGYPLMDWVLVPYAHQHLTWTQHAFNEKIGDIQKIAKEAFVRLKGRWSCLQKRTEVKLQDLPVVLGACCVLHNICEQRNEVMDEELRFELVDDEMIPDSCMRSVNSMKLRDTIAHNLLHHAHAGTAFL